MHFAFADSSGNRPLFCSFTPDQGQFRFRRAAFYSQLKSKVGNLLAKATALRINLNIDGAPIASRAHTPPLHLVCARLHHPPALALSLSPHRHPFYIFPPSSRFIRYHKHIQQQTTTSAGHPPLAIFPKDRGRGRSRALRCPMQVALDERV